MATDGLWANNALDSLDHDQLKRRIFFEWSSRARRYIADAVDDLHTLNNLSEDRVAPTRLVGVEGVVVVQIHIELGIAAVRILAASHADRAALIGQSIPGLIDDFRGGDFGLIGAIESTALNDEIRDDSMKNSAGIVSLIDIFQEIRDR